MPEERVQKILARAGYGSRRSSEELILAGRVKINGKAAELGAKADPQRDTITVDNQQIAKEQPPVYIAVNKPQGVLSEVSPDEPRQTVRDLVPVPGHMFIVGRLDMESEGLILLTNDGDLANRLSHPRYGHEKEYHVLVGARPDDRQLEAWRHGVVLEDGYRTAPAQVRVDTIEGRGAWLEVILREGRKRQIREMGKQTGLPVLRIMRVRIGTLLLGELRPGSWRHLKPDEIRALKVNKTYRPAPSSRPRGARHAERDAHSGERGAPQGEREGRRGEGRGESQRPPASRAPHTPHAPRTPRREAPHGTRGVPARPSSHEPSRAPGREPSREPGRAPARPPHRAPRRSPRGKP
jgi:23S rRNA pseudouridine2605 synthase